MSKRVCVVATAILSIFLCAGVPACADSPADEDSSGVDSSEKFIRYLATDINTKAELGRLSQQLSASDQIREYGRLVIADHSKMSGALSRLALKKNVTVPMDYDILVVRDLSEQDPQTFDRCFVTEMVETNTRAVTALESQSRGVDGDLRRWSKQTLPAARELLKQSQALEPAIISTK